MQSLKSFSRETGTQEHCSNKSSSQSYAGINAKTPILATR
jgi:hypothetical protein